MKIPQFLKYLLIGQILSAVAARAETINWYSAPKANLTSTGQNMDGAFQFQLGVFTGGFVPTAGNVSQWSAHWISAQSASYNPTTMVFESAFSFTGNSAPFSIGAKAYVWGRFTGSAKDEWILFRKNDWTWPDGSTVPAGFHDWNAAAANDVVLGTINTTGTPFLMKSESVHSYTQWRDGQFAGEESNTPAADPDHDGISNLLEFIFGTSPTSAGPPTPTPVSLVSLSGQRYLQIAIPRLRNRLATVTVEVSDDLTIWNSGDAFTTEVSNTADTLIVRDKIPTSPGIARRFMRIKVVTPP
ncbi:MAG: hypothetical protein V4584_18055 [Verrucomicrobiota bacterium]